MFNYGNNNEIVFNGELGLNGFNSAPKSKEARNEIFNMSETLE